MNKKDGLTPEDVKDLTGKEGGEGKQAGVDKEGDDKGKDDKEEGKEQFIPYSRFKEVNDSLKELKDFKEKAEKEKADREREKLISEGKLEEAYKNQLSEKDKLLMQKEQELKDLKIGLKLKDSGLSDKFKKLITGDTDEEISFQISEIKKEFGISTKNDVIGNLQTQGKEGGEDKKGKPKVFTLQEIEKMSTKEYKENRDEINKQIAAGLIK